MNLTLYVGQIEGHYESVNDIVHAFLGSVNDHDTPILGLVSKMRFTACFKKIYRSQITSSEGVPPYTHIHTPLFTLHRGSPFKHVNSERYFLYSSIFTLIYKINSCRGFHSFTTSVTHRSHTDIHQVKLSYL